MCAWIVKNSVTPLMATGSLLEVEGEVGFSIILERRAWISTRHRMQVMSRQLGFPGFSFIGFNPHSSGQC